MLFQIKSQMQMSETIMDRATQETAILIPVTTITATTITATTTTTITITATTIVITIMVIMWVVVALSIITMLSPHHHHCRRHLQMLPQ